MRRADCGIRNTDELLNVRSEVSEEQLTSESTRRKMARQRRDRGLVTALQPIRITQDDNCTLFQKWPFEIREIFCQDLLVAESIESPGALVMDETINFSNQESEKPFSYVGTDSAICKHADVFTIRPCQCYIRRICSLPKALTPLLRFARKAQSQYHVSA